MKRMQKYKASPMCDIANLLAITLRISVNAAILFFIWMVLRHVLHL